MKQVVRYAMILILTIAFFTSCKESRDRATEKFNELSEQAESINSEIDKGLKKVESLDSAVRSGARRIKEYDSIIEKNSAKIDSIARAKSKALEELTSF